MLTEQVIARIYGNKRGWCFTPKDFLDLGSPATVWQTLSRLEKKGTIRKIMRGVYDYPEKNIYLGGFASPDPDRIARTLARTYGWTIVPDGNTALALLGLSTQIPAGWQYLTDGPNKHYTIDTVSITFKKTAMRETAGLSRASAILLQGIKTLGEEHITEDVIKRIGEYLAPGQWKKTIRECRYIHGWIIGTMKKAAKNAEENQK